MTLTSQPISRRTVLIGGIAGLTLPWLLSGCAPSSPNAARTMRYAFWGGDARIAKFAEIQDRYSEQAGITFSREFADFGAYWERFATQVAARSLPDIVSMTEQQVGEYAGQLEDLQPFVDANDLDLSSWGSKYVDAGVVDGRLVQLFLGGTIPSLVFNQSALEAAGVTGDPNTWDWQQFADTCTRIGAASDGDRWGTSDGGGSSQLFDTFLHQRGAGSFVDGAIGWEPADLEEYLTLWAELRDAGGAPPFEITSEYSTAPFEDREIVRGMTVFQVGNHNHLPGLQDYTDGVLQSATLPVVGRGDRAALNAGTYVSVAANSPSKELAIGYLNWFVNDDEAITVFEAEYGGLPSEEANALLAPVVSEPVRRNIDFYDSVESIAEVVPPWPPQGQQMLTLIQQANESVALNRAKPAEAANTCFEQLSSVVG